MQLDAASLFFIEIYKKQKSAINPVKMPEKAHSFPS